MRDEGNRFDGGFAKSSIAFFTHHNASPFLNLLMTMILPVIGLYSLGDLSLVLFCFSSLSITAFDERLRFLLEQSQHALPSLLHNILHYLFISVTPFFISIALLCYGFSESLPWFVVGYFCSITLFSMGTIFSVAGFYHDILRYHAKGVQYQLLLLTVVVSIYAFPVVQSVAGEMDSSVSTEWSIVQSLLLIFLFVCYSIFQVCKRPSSFTSNLCCLFFVYYF